MRTCYKLSDSYTVFEMEEIGDVWYQRMKKIKAVLETETDAKRIEKAESIFLTLTIILEKMVMVTAQARKPMPPGFPFGGVPVSMRR